jgi:integrase
MARTMAGTSDVRIWSISAYRGARRTTYTIRWRTSKTRHQRTFATRKLAESFHARLLRAAKDGEDFRVSDGLPTSVAGAAATTTWYEFAARFIDMKWPDASPRHRKSMAEGLVTVTQSLVTARGDTQQSEIQRRTLLHWSFNTAARHGRRITVAAPPEHIVEPERWLREHSVPLERLADPAVTRQALGAIGRRLDGSAASPSTIARKRSALYGALEYAVELELLTTNPLDKVKSARTTREATVDTRAVVNPQQAERLLQAVDRAQPALTAFFACMYFAAMRPAEVRHLRLKDCELPETGWGNLLLVGSTPTGGRQWNDAGSPQVDRQLKHRGVGETRQVPAPPRLVAILREHIHSFPPGTDGRLFVTRTGRAGVPLAEPFQAPISMGIVYRTWQAARAGVLTPEQVASRLARRPYDLRHAAVSLWLNAGVPATQVAEWAGHSVNVLLRVYAKVIDGQQDDAMRRIQAALTTIGPADGPQGAQQTSARIPHGHP